MENIEEAPEAPLCADCLSTESSEWLLLYKGDIRQEMPSVWVCDACLCDAKDSGGLADLLKRVSDRLGLAK